MNENGYDNYQQYNNGYDQQYNNTYDNTPKIPLDLSNGLMSHLPEEMKDRIEDALAEPLFLQRSIPSSRFFVLGSCFSSLE